MDDLKAYYFYRKLNLKPFLKQSNKMDSVLMKLGNYASLETKKGLKQASKQSKEVYKDFKNKSLEDIKKAIIQKEKTTIGQSNFFQKL